MASVSSDQSADQAAGNPPVVVITGASAGIGRATAVAFAGRGAKVALLARGEVGLEGAAREVREAGGEALVIPVDVADAEAVQRAAERAETELGPVDVWVNSAFTSVFAPFSEVSAEEFRRVTEVTYLGTVYATQAALKLMRPRDRGAIVQVGSALAYRGIPLQSAYCGAKHAVQGFHESLRIELMNEGSGIRTTMVQMPAVNTPQFSWVLSRLPKQAQPVPPIYQPEVAAQAVLYAADHPGRREYWVGTGAAKTILGNALVPAVLDKYLSRTGFSSQQTPDPRPADQPQNLWEPADGPGGRDFGSHGLFDDQARTSSKQQWVAHRVGALTSAVGPAVASAGAGLIVLTDKAKPVVGALKSRIGSSAPGSASSSGSASSPGSASSSDSAQS
ncbi:SDR family oxidoreductase [Kineosporia sp. J2-2]|uniref:SDR family oxidoreductase n=1 Tax=Kineosporia corallincola TaxID=2835133 RepID=A0ABS5TRJ4_9ACTN|nr:SDR family oxidoreductase [Kineosporia corallincola]MBT0773413.1 SDR family oxidoreductase [Kineosporia corallincola]